jgi:hypothetical protein
MRRRPTIETITFHCPVCSYRQRGYFAVCPTPGCNDNRIREFVAEMKRRIEENNDDVQGS